MPPLFAGSKNQKYMQWLFINDNVFRIEPRREKTGLRDFRPGPTQTGLYSLRSRLEA